jgi:uncharacterized protein YndB with AHSA1/START domain
MSERASTRHSALGTRHCEELTYVEAPPEVVYRLVRDLEQHARWAPPGVRYGRRLTAAGDEPGARVAVAVRRWGPFWRDGVVQLHAVEAPRCVIVGPPEGGAGLVRWTLEPEPPGTVVTVRREATGSVAPLVGPLLGAWRAARVARELRDLLARLKALAERENPLR